MHEQNQQRQKYSLREAFAIGATAVALVGPALFAQLQSTEQGQQKAATEMLELYGEAAMACGLVAAGKKFNAVLDETHQR